MTRTSRAVVIAATAVCAVVSGCAEFADTMGMGRRTTTDDASISAAVESGLATDRLRSALNNVDVRTNEGVVRLTGTVPNATAKQRATEIAQDVRGVRQVVNNVRTEPDQRADTRDQNDDRITAALEHRLSNDRSRATLTKVDVETSNGTVTLTGTVPDATAKRRAGELAREVAGVKRVVDQLRTSTAGDAPARKYRPATKPNP